MKLSGPKPYRKDPRWRGRPGVIDREMRKRRRKVREARAREYAALDRRKAGIDRRAAKIDMPRLIPLTKEDKAQRRQVIRDERARLRADRERVKNRYQQRLYRLGVSK